MGHGLLVPGSSRCGFESSETGNRQGGLERCHNAIAEASSPAIRFLGAASPAGGDDSKSRGFGPAKVIWSYDAGKDTNRNGVIRNGGSFGSAGRVIARRHGLCFLPAIQASSGGAQGNVVCWHLEWIRALTLSFVCHPLRRSGGARHMSSPFTYCASTSLVSMKGSLVNAEGIPSHKSHVSAGCQRDFVKFQLFSAGEPWHILQYPRH